MESETDEVLVTPDFLLDRLEHVRQTTGLLLLVLAEDPAPPPAAPAVDAVEALREVLVELSREARSTDPARMTHDALSLAVDVALVALPPSPPMVTTPLPHIYSDYIGLRTLELRAAPSGFRAHPMASLATFRDRAVGGPYLSTAL